MTRTISAMAFAASVSSRPMDSDPLRRWRLSRLVSCVSARMASAASSSASAARSARGYPEPCGPRRAFVGVGIAVRLGSAVCPQSVFVCLESPNRGGIKPSRPKPRSGGATQRRPVPPEARSGSLPSAAKGHAAGQSVRRLATTDLTGPDQTRVSDATRWDLRSSGQCRIHASRSRGC